MIIPMRRQWQLRQFQDYLAKQGQMRLQAGLSHRGLLRHRRAVIEKLHPPPFVSAGRINIDKLNSGEEILVVAPAECDFVEEKLDDGSRIHSMITP